METKSGIYGLVVGDALGVPVEFKDRDFLKTSFRNVWLWNTQCSGRNLE